MSLYSQKFDKEKLREKFPSIYDEAVGAASYTFDKKGWIDNE